MLATQTSAGEQDPGDAAAVIRSAGRLGRPRPWVPLLGLALLALVVAAVVWWRGQSQPAAQTFEVAVPGVPPTVAAGQSASIATATVTVDVGGKVNRPGVVTLPGGSRVAQAITAAGGLVPGTSTQGVNLARRVNDGEQILVGVPGTETTAGTPGQPVATPDTSGAQLDLNAATAEQLDELPRIGPATAAKIIDFRATHGPFRSIDQLLDVPGIGEATLSGIRSRLRTG